MSALFNAVAAEQGPTRSITPAGEVIVDAAEGEAAVNRVLAGG